MIRWRALGYDYGFRCCPVPGLFPKPVADPRELASWLGDVIEFPDGVVVGI